ncbi:hypothetical protein [Cytobacillus sp. IB215665]|uniref:hypothetical protein n=1 Tax=Cytobacillus sp. IB215665 TaxID=3097357 RepID=UPI002A0B55E5|nr:hypothetical protein [Cytobacillus sp. IB215665]MDX8367173.1 hypothetical protein [Cytobacillus sp. IB215665]
MYFAVHVKTGWEAQTIEFLQHKIKKTHFEGIASVFAPILDVKKFVGEDYYVSDYKVMGSSYIYIKIQNLQENTFRIPAKIYHFIKSISSVLKVMEYSVPKEEIESFCNNYGLALEESEVEIKLDEKVIEEADMDKEKARLLHEANVSEKETQIDEKIENVINQKRTIDVVQEIIEEGKNKHHRLLKKCRAFIRNKRETFRFPLAIFLKTRRRIDPEKKLSLKKLTSTEFILPEIIKTLLTELNSDGNVQEQTNYVQIS